MTLKIEDVEAGDWLTCVDADDSPLMEGHDYQIAEIDGDDGGYVAFSGVTDGPFAVSRFTRRQFRVGDVVEFVSDFFGAGGGSDKNAIVTKYDTGREHIYVDRHPGLPIHSIWVRLVTPAHLVANPQPEPDQADPSDAVNHPSHYTSHPSGVECIAIIEEFPYNRGAAIGYIWRAGLKDDEIQDLKKAAWHINREIERLEKQREKGGAK